MNISDRLIISIMLLSILARINGGSPDWHHKLLMVMWLVSSVFIELAKEDKTE